MATNKDVGEILALFRSLFPNYQPGDMAMAAKTWSLVIGHIPAEELKAAALSAAAEPGRAFAPSVGEVIGAVMRIRAQVEGLPSALEAYGMVLSMPDGEGVVHEYRCPAYYASQTPGEAIAHLKTCRECADVKRLELHPLVKRIALQFGWPHLFPGDNPEADRAHFIRAYEAELARQTSRLAQPEPVQKYIEKNTSARVKELAEGMKI